MVEAVGGLVRVGEGMAMEEQEEEECLGAMGEEKEVVAVGEGLAVLEEEEEGLEVLGEGQEVVVVVVGLAIAEEGLEAQGEDL